MLGSYQLPVEFYVITTAGLMAIGSLIYFCWVYLLRNWKYRWLVGAVGLGLLWCIVIILIVQVQREKEQDDKKGILNPKDSYRPRATSVEKE